MVKSILDKLLILSTFSAIVIVVYLLVQEEDSSNQQPRQFVTLLTYLHEEVINTSGTYAKLDRSLCEHQQPVKRYYDSKKPCPSHVVTVKQGGRLCNQIWEYLAVWAVAKRTGFEPYVPTCLYNTVASMYDSLTVGRLEEIAHCPLNESSFVTSNYGRWDKSSNLILPMYITEPKLSLAFRKDFPKEFVLKKNLLEESQRQIRSLKVPSNTVYVGVHVRRTDYPAYLKRKFDEDAADPKYYDLAMRLFEYKYKLVAFVMVSDDPSWCYREFGKRKNVHVMGYARRNSPQLDLAILSSCNHTIIDYGTYGAWGAIMAGGETMYYNITKHYITRSIGGILNWTTL